MAEEGNRYVGYAGALKKKNRGLFRHVGVLLL